MRVGARALVAFVAGMVLLAGCGGSSSTSSGEPPVPADVRGPLLVDCWNDTLTELDPASAARGRSFAFAAEDDGAVRLCDWSPGDGAGGVTAYRADGTLLAASRSGDDDSSHAGFLDVATGTFTDLSARLRLDANGDYTDEGSGVDDFAGPVKDRVLGFAPDGSLLFVRAAKRYAAAAPGYTDFRRLPDDELIGLTSPDGSRTAGTSLWSGVLSLPAGTPDVPPGTDTDPADVRTPAGFAPIALLGEDVAEDVGCDRIGWIDDATLLCQDTGSVTLVDLSGAQLVAATDLAEQVASCSLCWTSSWIWTLPAGSVRDATPASSRELFGFVADPARGVAWFLADAGTAIRLYSIGSRRGATPKLVGEFQVGDDPTGSSWTGLLVR
ncbi:hypothetical protein GIS00_23645 [Nakamurella sp. YIM 132087]|uniref:Uncharacterized protein n=1 Tax=Nakamurella alba TaxID=2665158 RepID=A0A7K1FUQ4_9ACTN|nr:hypothetical protein [Nakamurella alba]MTD16933.1 hypothetical protein [Nakamurella alba]